MRKPYRYSYWMLVLIVLMPVGGQAQNPLLKSSDAESQGIQRISVEAPPDDVLESRLQAIFSHIVALKNVQVKVNDGVVELSGKVLRAADWRKAQNLASRLEGVVYVESRIEEETDVETRVSPTIEKIRQFFNSAYRELPVVGVALAIVFLFYLLSRLILRWESPFVRLGVDPLMRNVVRQIMRSLIVLVGLVLALEILDLTTLVGALVGTASIVGIAFGFGFRKMVKTTLRAFFSV